MLGPLINPYLTWRRHHFPASKADLEWRHNETRYLLSNISDKLVDIRSLLITVPEQADVVLQQNNRRAPVKTNTLNVLMKRGIDVHTVIDVGVLNGTPELIQAYPHILHILFEPVIEFQLDIENKYADIPHKLVPLAVSDRSGRTALEVVTVFSDHDITYSAMSDETPEKAKRSVAMVSLDDYLAKNPSCSPYFLKIDIDGQEMKVLRGAEETLKQTSVVMIEVTVDNIVERLSYLSEKGFKLFDLTESCYYDDSLWQCDAVLIRRDIHLKSFETISDSVDRYKWQIFA